jgi:hypothetical protein
VGAAETAYRKPLFDSESDGLTQADAMTMDFTAAEGTLGETVLCSYVC